MALRFGNTTRLHHIDFPTASPESETRTGIHSIQSRAVTQAEIMKPTASTPGSQQKTGKINVRVRKNRQEKETTRKTRSSLPSTQIKSENSNSTESCGLTQEDPSNSTSKDLTQQTGVCYMNLTVEWDVLDSFSEFAAFLEVQNPICPAHLIDTPEKLLSVLSCEL